VRRQLAVQVVEHALEVVLVQVGDIAVAGEREVVVVVGVGVGVRVRLASEGVVESRDGQVVKVEVADALDGLCVVWRDGAVVGRGRGSEGRVER
jgi:hypothetical protein